MYYLARMKLEVSLAFLIFEAQLNIVAVRGERITDKATYSMLLIVSNGFTLAMNKERIKIGITALSLLAISLVSVGGMLKILDSNGQAITPQQVYDTYFELPASINAYRGSNEEASYDYGLFLLESKRYAESLKWFQHVKDSLKDNGYKLCYSIAHLEGGDAHVAIKNLSEIRHSNSPFQGTASWYLALAYLKEKNLDNSKNILIELKNNKSSGYSKQASVVLKKIRRLER